MGVEWEGGVGVASLDGSSQGRLQDRFLVEADDMDGAVRMLRSALKRYGTFAAGFVAEEVVPPVGWLGLNTNGPDWAAVGRRHGLSARQCDALEALLNAAEPTWIVMRELDSEDRSGIEALLGDLEDRGLVWHVNEESYDPHGEVDRDDWWALTDRGWEVVGLIKRPTYNTGRHG